MAKLIPLSSKKMKEMGIVKSKNGFLMKEIKKQSPKPERYVEDKAPKQHETPRHSTNYNNTVNKVERKQESQRLADRGIY